jgi:hypothetical protein
MTSGDKGAKGGLRLEQTSLYDFLESDDQGSAGNAIRFISLGPIEEYILRRLDKAGPMGVSDLLASRPAGWTRGGVTGRLTELTYPDRRLVESRYVKGSKRRQYSITPRGRQALRGEPL